MLKKSVYKIPGGKMVRIGLDYEENIIKDIKITGDFFIYPEEGINLLEQGLKNTELADVLSKAKEIVEKNNLLLLGLTAEGINEAVKLAIR